jgi:hypothetical protein
MNDAKTQHAIERVVGVLEAGVGRNEDHEALQAEVEADFDRYDSARIRDFVPVLVENDIRARILTSDAN